MGIFGGPFVFLAAAFAYLADFTRASGRGRAFASLDSLLLMVASLGPLVGSTLVEHMGYVGVWSACALAYCFAALSFALAPASPQPTPKASAGRPCGELLATCTPALLLRMLRDRRQRVLCLAFVLAMGGINGGLSCFILYAQRFLGWKQQQIGYFIAAFSLTASAMIMLVHPALSRIAGRRISDRAMVRSAYVGPVTFLLAIGFVPQAHATVAAFGMIPLLAMGATALPHFRALFSQAKHADEQGEQMALIAALESLPQLYASPLASLGFRYCLHAPWPVFVTAATMPTIAMGLLWCCVPPQIEAEADLRPASNVDVVAAESAAALESVLASDDLAGIGRRAAGRASVGRSGMERGLLAEAADDSR